MATFYSDAQQLKKNLEAGTGYSLGNGLITVGARIHYAIATITGDPLIVAGSLIEALTIPKGARLMGLEIDNGAVGAGVTVSVGIDKDLIDDTGAVQVVAGPAALLAATSVATPSAAPVVGLPSFATGRLGITSAPTVLSLTSAGGALATGSKIKVVLAYLWN